MRQRPKEFRVALRAQWVCAAVDHLLGRRDLADVPALMAGFGSLLDHPAVGNFARAAFALRQLDVSVGSSILLRQAVHDAILWEEEHRDDDDYEEPPYEIDAESSSYAFTLRPGTEVRARRWVSELLAGLPFAAWTTPRADQDRPMRVLEGAVEGAESIGIDLSHLPPLPVPAKHDLTRRPRGPIEIPLAELEDVARRLDAMDAADPRRPRGNWLGRLREGEERKFHVLAPDRGAGRLDETDTIRIAGLTHLIGLPGTGKSTLIVLLLIWLDENGYQTTVLLPSIEASLNLLGDLRFYGADVGLLVGQSPDTRIGHARKLAERLGADEARGFGRSGPGADLLGLTCALGAFDTDPEGHEGFPHLMPPCNAVHQRGLKQDGTEKGKETWHLCPLSGACGRMTAPRELARRRIWLGHVLSMDTRISPHFADERARYFEAVAMASDLVIVDEADGAQADLDRKAITTLDLTGSRDSYEHRLIRDLFSPIAAGANDVTASNVQSYGAAAADFQKLNRSLVVQLVEDRRANGDTGTLSRFRDTFVTGNNVLTTLFSAPDISVLTPAERAADERRFGAIRAFWDGCIRAALTRRTDQDDDVEEYEFDAMRVAQDLGSSEQAVRKAAIAIADSVRDWISEPLPTRREDLLAQAREATFALIPYRDELSESQATDLFRFLVNVTTVIFQFLSLIPAQQAMVAEGVHREPLFKQGVSPDFARVVPEALLGRLSGLRFQFEDSGPRSGVQVKYVTFLGAPRVLLYRLHELLRHDGREAGPAVLLASATSYLAESPTFHIPSGPHLVLRRNGAMDGWRNSRYVFAPIRDPEAPGRFLRFSGSPLGARERILRAMVDHYASGETPHLVDMGRDFDEGRKPALVVNSYAQVREVKNWLRRRHPSLAPRVIAVTDDMPERNEGDWITAAQVERLGQREDWDALVFPMKALSRGVNIVFEQGPRSRDALLGTMIFLVRPHPATESLDLVAGLTGARTLDFDTARFPAAATLGQLTHAWAEARGEMNRTARRLLRFPAMASRLGDLAVPFTADIMVDVLQTIGRAMRNGMKARVIFADAAWAPLSAEGRRDTPRSSMLVTMRDILRARLNDSDPVDREVYRSLYEPFLHPLERCGGLRFHDGASDDDE